MSLISIFITIAIIGVLVWALTLLPMPTQIKNVIIGVAILLIVLWVVKSIGLEVRI